MQESLAQIRRLAIFATVVEQGSFSAAGRKLGLGRGKVSEQISALEQALSVRLLQRSTRQLSVTAEGQVLYRHCRDLLPQASQGLREVQDLGPEPMGRLRLTTTSDVAQQVLSPFLSRFCQQYPGIQLDLQLADAVLNLVEEDIDIAIRIGTPVDSSMVGIELGALPMGLYAATSYLAQWGVPESLPDLSAHRGVQMTRMPNLSTLMLSNDEGVSQPAGLPVFHRTDTPAGNATLVEQGLGIGLLPHFTLNQAVSEGRVRPVLPEWQYRQLAITLLFPSRAQLPRRSRLFIDALRDWLRDGEGKMRLQPAQLNSK
ncbi:LysR family transcriptional regulator [Ferrimonas balearica]|uniref:LysR family transcriptional regulator n=1 Tax=Ferrimonas balearica TaxID=44012 RepID=UPI001C94BDA2|nr:LysR family transcriptional regulator [Ferrimonas balearica]MBY5982164.1 LysR family transcriptional regulator [Ferrimonas balearica]